MGIEDAEDITHFGGWRAFLQSLPLNQQPDKELHKTRDFLKTFGEAAGASSSFPEIFPGRGRGALRHLVVVSGSGINSLDLHRKGTNRPSYQVTVNIYDRLVRFGVDRGRLDGLRFNQDRARSRKISTASDDRKALTFKTTRRRSSGMASGSLQDEGSLIAPSPGASLSK